MPGTTGTIVTNFRMPATTRCPRCAYALTGLPGAPAAEHAYGQFTADERCPECALQIPVGAHCLVGGATPDVVDASGSRSLISIVAAGTLLIGGPWACILIGVVLVNALRGATLRSGVPMSALPAWAIGSLPGVLALSIGGWLIWRTWRRTGTGTDGERAGARMRRAMVVPGGVHLWSGEPTLDAKARSLAGGDVRDVRGRRHIPLFRKKGAAETGAIDFVTPIILWSAGDVKRQSNITDGRLAGTIWLVLPPGVPADVIARDIERTLRQPAADTPVHVDITSGMTSVPAPTVHGDPNHLAVPEAVTASTPGDRPICPRCSYGLPVDQPGPWWEPLPAAVTCPECALSMPAGAVVVNGWQNASQAQIKRGGLGKWIIIGGAFFTVFLAVSIVLIVRDVSAVWGGILQFAALFGFPFLIIAAIRWNTGIIARPRVRFQQGTETWIAEPGQLRIVTRGKHDARETVIPARGISTVTFGQSFGSDNSMPVQTDQLSMRGTAAQLGMTGERHLSVPLPAEVDQEKVVANIKSALTPTPHPLPNPLR